MADDEGLTDGATDFGYRQVPVAEKKTLVRAVFDSVAPRYDVMDDVMSLGVHRVWKRIFATVLRPSPRAVLLDLASGTGDIALAWRRLGGGPVIATDINAAMLARGRDRAIGGAEIDGVAHAVMDAERLALPDGAADVVSMAFGLRNCTDRAAVLAEARRVLEGAYDRWSFGVLPRLGRAIAGDAESYRYLAESIRMFPDQEMLAGMMRAAGFSQVSHRNLSGGIVAIHTGWRT